MALNAAAGLFTPLLARASLQSAGSLRALRPAAAGLQHVMYSNRGLSNKCPLSHLHPSDTFARRHNGPQVNEVKEMLKTLKVNSVDALIEQTIPGNIRMKRTLSVGEPRTETQALGDLKAIASKNKIYRSLIGAGYYDTITPYVILRNVIENPRWYTPYTPYQAEISQGRLESLLNYQTMVSDLTGFPVSNASLLDEATAAAEAMYLCYNSSRNPRQKFFVSELVHPQSIALVKTRAEAFNIEVIVGDHTKFTDFESVCGVLVQYPATDGTVFEYKALADAAHKGGALVVAAADLLSLTVLTPPSEWGADVALGSSQRFGVPLGYGGPHAAFFATSDKYKRSIPGRIIGVSRDSDGRPALRMAMQTREQHIRREKATSNICTAQALLANCAAMYAVYHGPEGLKQIANRVNGFAKIIREGAKRLGHSVPVSEIFDTVRIGFGSKGDADAVMHAALNDHINLRRLNDTTITISIDEKTTLEEANLLLKALNRGKAPAFSAEQLGTEPSTKPGFSAPLSRKSAFLTHDVFNQYHSETEMMRYLNVLNAKDYGLCNSMIPLGSCTMKLNAAAEMIPITWPEFGALHPFVPADQAQGYKELFETLGKDLADVTGFHTVSLQPNSGSNGEYAGLRVIAKYFQHHGQSQRNVCLIPLSAHGTNPASAAIAGFKIVPVAVDEHGNIDLADLETKAVQHKDHLACVMVTYPSTHGVFEEGIKKLCDIIHTNGGLVYMDGANMNAQVGFCSPGDIGADVCHLNLHKTFCIPHGGGGPGVGPIGVVEKLAPFLPGHPVVATGGKHAMGPVAAAPFGSASILPISWMYVKMMGSQGLQSATAYAIMNANYMAERLKGAYNVLYTGTQGRCAHEFILDLRSFKASAGITEVDIAKRLLDYGFHAPTMSWPVAGTLMIEPTESENKAELDRFCEALLSIREEIRKVEEGKFDPKDNPLKNAPHPLARVISDTWNHKYSREEAAYPLPWVRGKKFWPSVGRLDDVFGDRNVVCSCPPMETYYDISPKGVKSQ